MYTRNTRGGIPTRGEILTHLDMRLHLDVWWYTVTSRFFVSHTVDLILYARNAIHRLLAAIHCLLAAKMLAAFIRLHVRRGRALVVFG
jgi:hypothetical protein